MFFKPSDRQTAVIILFAFSVAGCNSIHKETVIPPPPTISETPLSLLTSSTTPTVPPHQLSPALDLSHYAFPDSIDATKRYMFYLHGKIIEDQGIPAISPEFGEYEYETILGRLSEFGFVLISDQRPKNTDGMAYARKIAEQVATLLEAGVPAKNITVVGASKGAGIAVYVSHFLGNEEMNFVIMAICHPDQVEAFRQEQIFLYGNILSIYDSSDKFAGSCQDLFSFSDGKGISRHKEIVLSIGTGHGILYQPLDEWIIPTVEWAGKP